MEERRFFVFGGPPETGKTWTAHKFAARCGLPLISLVWQRDLPPGTECIIYHNMTPIGTGLSAFFYLSKMVKARRLLALVKHIIAETRAERISPVQEIDNEIMEGVTDMVWFGPNVPAGWEPAAQWCMRMGLPPPLEPMPQ
jgi:hypothetical protein